MDLSIVIINWNSSEYLKACLATIYNHLGNITHEIIVVDNASYDGCDQFVKNTYPNVIFIQSDKNLGFSKANNLGATRTCGRYLLFLNPDTEVLGTAINVMLANLDSLPNAGAVGCKLLNSDLTLQTSCIQPFPTIVNQLFDIEYLRMKTPGLKLWGIRPLFSNNVHPEEVQVISGACIMIKKHVFEEIGGFSEDYFMYAEDIDLCHKINQAGYKNYYVKDATLIHHGGGSSREQDESNFSSVLMREAVFIFLKKTKGIVAANSYKRALMVSSIFRLLALKILILPFFKDRLFRRADKKWEMVFRWSIGLEKRKLASI